MARKKLRKADTLNPLVFIKKLQKLFSFLAMEYPMCETPPERFNNAANLFKFIGNFDVLGTVSLAGAAART